MRRDTLAFTIAGVVFGFVLGYMAASWDAMPRPAPVAIAPAGTGAAPAGGAAAAPPSLAAPAHAPIDPDEVKALESLAQRQPGDAAVRTELGNLYMDHERWDEAIRWYREALGIDPANPDVRTDMGACFVHSGRPEQGLAEFEAVLKAKPDHRNALFNRGVALVNMGRSAEAADAWQALLARYPDDPQLQRLRGRIDELRATAGPAGTAAPTGKGR
jgi:cytochrome c-type biogenesis protein CcmH/NrfG